MDLWAHQKRAVNKFRFAGHGFVQHEMGIGKTLTASTLIADRFARNGESPTLILAPKPVSYGWWKHMNEFQPKLAPYVVLLEGSQTQRIETSRKAIAQSKYIFVTNMEVVNMSDLWSLLSKWLAEDKNSIFVFDESHKIKGPKTIRAKRVIALADKVGGLKLALSGSPVLNGTEDIWAQIRFLNRNILPENFFEFRRKFMYDANANWSNRQGYFPKWRMLPDAIDRLRTILEPHVDICSAKDGGLKLPPLIRQEIYVDLDKVTEKHYRAMERDFVTYVNSGACVADLAITKLLRLQQIASGILAVDGRDSAVRLPCAKAEALKELLHDLCDGTNEKVIIWNHWRDCHGEIRGVCESAGLKAVEIIGGQSDQDRQQAIADFRDDGDTRVCIASQGAGGTGIDGLQAARYSVYYSKTQNLEHDIQSEKRNHRGGSEIHKSVHRIDIITRGTVEEQITEALKSKLTVAELLTKFRNTDNTTKKRKGAKAA